MGAELWAEALLAYVVEYLGKQGFLFFHKVLGQSTISRLQDYGIDTWW